nr:JmjC domain-containing protein [Tanacetum cinerariifolium]
MYNLGVIKSYATVLDEIKKKMDVEAETIQIILTGIDNDIFSTVDACPNAINNGKDIVNTSSPTYDLEPEAVNDDESTQKEKEIDKLMALISVSFKKIYKPINNNLRTSSNTRIINVDNTLKSNRRTGYERLTGQYDNQREVNVIGARENIAKMLRQMEEYQLGKGAARQIHEEDMDEMERERDEAQRKRQQEVLKSAKFYNVEDWLTIQAQVEANVSLSKTLLGDDVSEDNFPARMAALIKNKRQALAEQLFKKTQNQPLTSAQQKAYMRQYVKNQSSAIYNTGWSMAYVKSFSDEQLLQEFEKIRKDHTQIQLQSFSRTFKRRGSEGYIMSPTVDDIATDLDEFYRLLKEEIVVDLKYFNSLKKEVESLESQLELQEAQFSNENDRLSRE